MMHSLAGEMCRKSAAAMLGAILAVSTWGCSGLELGLPPAEKASGWQRVELPDISQDQAMAAGRKAMGQYFRSMETSPRSGKIHGPTVEYVQSGGTGRIRDGALKHKNRMRRQATLWISASPSGCVVRCRVRVQRLDTADHRLFQNQRQFDDLPSATPIDREAATTKSQNEVWTEMPRDRRFESELLQVLLSRVSAVRSES